MKYYSTSFLNNTVKFNNHNIVEYYRNGTFPKEAWDSIMKNWVYKALSESFKNLDGVKICQFIESLAYHSRDGGLNFSIVAHSLASVLPMILYGSTDQKEEFLDKMLNGSLLFANSATEGQAGSDISNLKSKATLQADGSYQISAEKIFVSNIVQADYAIVYVMTDENKGLLGGLSVCIVSKDEYRVTEVYNKMGLRTSSLGTLVIENITVRETQFLGPIGAGFSVFNAAMEWERLGMSSMHVGTMQRLFENVLLFVKKRKQGGKLIGKHQVIAHKIAEVKTHIHTSRLLVLDASLKIGKQRDVGEIISMCKWKVSETFVKVCETILQIYGGIGYLENGDIQRCVRDSYASKIYSGTNEIQKNIIARWNGL